jgi:hypothetical protein
MYGKSPFAVQVSHDAHVRLGGRFDVNWRRSVAWSKHWTRQAIEEMLVLVDGVTVPLEIFKRFEERVAPEESEKVKKRFRSWAIPV